MCKIDPAACRVDMQRCAFRIFKADLAAGGSNFQRVALIICDLRLAACRLYRAATFIFDEPSRCLPIEGQNEFPREP